MSGPGLGIGKIGIQVPADLEIPFTQEFSESREDDILQPIHQQHLRIRDDLHERVVLSIKVSLARPYSGLEG